MTEFRSKNLGKPDVTKELPGILVSQTTRVLAMASGLDFEDRGERDVDGAASGQRSYAYAAEGDLPAS